MVKNFTVIVFEDYFFKNLQRKRFFKTARVNGGRLTIDSVHALCVFLCTPSLNQNENPYEVPSVREIRF